MVALSHTNRSVFKLEGPDVFSFLQGVMTNDIQTLPEKEILYTVMLTSTGRFQFEFFLYLDPGEKAPGNKKVVYLETPRAFAPALLQRLKIFKLRSDVEIQDMSDETHVVTYHGGNPPKGLVFKDPRCDAMGYRGLVFGELSSEFIEDEPFYTALCLENCIPRAGAELIPEKTIPLEANLEELGALSFTKGCYLGQELTARTKHQGLVRKKLYPVYVEGEVSQDMLEEGIIIYGGEHKIGELLSCQQGIGIAKLRIEHVENSDVLDKNLIWQGVLKGTKKDCCKVRYLPRK